MKSANKNKVQHEVRNGKTKNIIYFQKYEYNLQKDLVKVEMFCYCSASGSLIALNYLEQTTQFISLCGSYFLTFEVLHSSPKLHLTST